jgi:3-methyladenine DNA glycosylase AlkD
MFENKVWDNLSYLEYIKYLKSFKNQKYKEFQSKLTITKYEILGLNIPLQRKIAKDILKSDITSFFKIDSNKYFEEVMIKAFVIASLKDKDLFLKELEKFIILIDNWAICDSFCNSLKIIREDEVFYFNYFSKYLKSKEEYRVRVGIVVLLNYYINDKYLDIIFNLIDKIKLDTYYVNMAIAWLLCECFIKYRSKTLKYLLKNNLNSFTFNKTISKINDSYRVSNEDKIYLKSLRRKGTYEKN